MKTTISYHSARTRTNRGGQRAGFSLLEVMFAAAVLAIAISGAASAMISAIQLDRVNRETAVATQEARRIMERIQEEDYRVAWDTFNPAGAAGANFTVPNLAIQAGDPDGFAGEIVFPAAFNGATGEWEIREDFADVAMGMPTDLNGDGDDFDSFGAGGGYDMLPVRVRVRWRGASGDRTLDLVTILGAEVMRARPNTRSGFSMVELLVAMLILAALLGAMGMTIMQGSGAFQQGVAANVVESQARRGIDRIASEFTSAELASLVDPATPFDDGEMTNNVQFRMSAGLVGGVPQWTETAAMAFQLDPGEIDDGLDNDGDGVVDEGRVVFTENAGLANEVNRVMCTNVREFLEGEVLNGLDDNGNGLVDEPGFTLDRQGETLNIRLSLERLDPDQRSLVRTIETSVLLRN